MLDYYVLLHSLTTGKLSSFYLLELNQYPHIEKHILVEMEDLTMHMDGKFAVCFKFKRKKFTDYKS